MLDNRIKPHLTAHFFAAIARSLAHSVTPCRTARIGLQLRVERKRFVGEDGVIFHQPVDPLRKSLRVVLSTSEHVDHREARLARDAIPQVDGTVRACS